MAGSLQPKRAQWGGVYPGSMVARGGQWGRPKQVHMGINTRSGGANTAGSRKRAISSGMQAFITAAYSGKKNPGKAGLTPGMEHWINGPNHQKPANKLPGSGSSGGGTKPPANTTTKPPVVQTPEQQAVWRQLTAYLSPMSALNAEDTQKRDEWARELERNPQLLDLALQELTSRLTRDTYSSNASLAKRGIFNSGERNRVNTSRLATGAEEQTNLSQKYGAARSAEIAAQRNAWANEVLQRQAQADMAAIDAYNQLYPAAKVDYYKWMEEVKKAANPPKPTTPAPTTPAPTTGGKQLPSTPREPRWRPNVEGYHTISSGWRRPVPARRPRQTPAQKWIR